MSNVPGARVPGAPGKPLHIVYATVAGGGGETYVREIGQGLVALGHRVSIVYLYHSPIARDTTPRRVVESMSPSYRKGGDIHAADAVRVDYTAPGNIHYYYNRVTVALPGAMRRGLPNAAAIKAIEAALALRRVLRRIARSSGGIDLLEFPDHMHYPSMFLRDVAPYAVRLHSSTADWLRACGEPIGPDYRREMRLEESLLHGARIVTAPSVAMAEHAASFYRYPRSRIIVAPNPLDTEMFSPGQDDGAGQASVGRDPSTGQATGGETKNLSVLYVGRLDPYKGLTTFARAARAILTAFPGATIDIVGGESAAVDVFAHVPASLRERVVLHGRVARSDLPRYYRRAAVCVVPSRWEPWGYTVAEAMACGRPVVGSRVGGIAESVLDGVTGVLIPPDDPAALADAVNSLLADPARRDAMGLAARERAVKQFDRSVITARMLDLYREALAYEGGRAGSGNGDKAA